MLDGQPTVVGIAVRDEAVDMVDAPCDEARGIREDRDAAGLERPFRERWAIVG